MTELKTKIDLPGGEILLKVVSEQELVLPKNNGYIVRPVLLHFIQECDPDLADYLHELNLIRPYAVSHIKQTFKRISENRHDMIIKPQETIIISIRIVSNDLLKKILNAFLTHPNQSLNILNRTFRIVSVEYKRTTITSENFTDRLKVYFNTPTYFSMKRSEFSMLFPEPKYLFLNLAKIWNENEDIDCRIDEVKLSKWIEQNVTICNYNLYTKKVYVGKKTPINGFQGWVVYRISSKTEMFNWLGILAEFGKLTNIGGNRTAGLGEIHVVWLKEREKENMKIEGKNEKEGEIIEEKSLNESIQVRDKKKDE